MLIVLSCCRKDVGLTVYVKHELGRDIKFLMGLQLGNCCGSKYRLALLSEIALKPLKLPNCEHEHENE